VAAESALQPSSIAFWLKKAAEIKKVADLCWNLDETVEHRMQDAELEGIARSLVETSLGLDADLKWLYGNLMAFAIQYVCIGILIERNPQRFLKEVPGYRIIELAEECGIELNKIQMTVLKQVESAFKWGQQKSQWHVELTREQMLALKDKHHAEQLIKPEDKQELEKLFSTLRKMAISRMVELQHTSTAN